MSLIYDNEIVDLATREVARETQSSISRFGNRGPRPSAAAGSVGLQARAADSARTAVPSSLGRAALPIPCSVDWERRERRGPEGSVWTVDGSCTLDYSEHVARHVIREGALVRFRHQLPGQEELWFQVVDLTVDPPEYASDPGLVEFTLRGVRDLALEGLA